MAGSLVVVAGATGKMGSKITGALLAQGATVRALVRRGTAADRLQKLSARGIQIVEADLNQVAEVTAACQGATCLVSALLGLREVMIDTQTVLLDAAIEAGVPRFLPSDYAMDFTRLAPGSNRNLDLHREFAEHADRKASLSRSEIQITSILNGMFMELLTGEAPFILFKAKRVLCWGDPNQKMDFTTMDDTAAYTAHAVLNPAVLNPAVLDAAAPRWLRIAGDQLSANGLAEVASEVTGQKFKVLRPGGLGLFGGLIKLVRKLNPALNEPFPAWQGMQYMHNMFEGKGFMPVLDNYLYPGLHWTRVHDLLAVMPRK